MSRRPAGSSGQEAPLEQHTESQSPHAEIAATKSSTERRSKAQKSDSARDRATLKLPVIIARRIATNESRKLSVDIPTIFHGRKLSDQIKLVHEAHRIATADVAKSRGFEESSQSDSEDDGMHLFVSLVV